MLFYDANCNARSAVMNARAVRHVRPLDRFEPNAPNLDVMDRVQNKNETRMKVLPSLGLGNSFVITQTVICDVKQSDTIDAD